MTTAVCVLPGTELAFAQGRRAPAPAFWLGVKRIKHKTAIFRQIISDQPPVHHDALEFPDGKTILLTELLDGQEATVPPASGAAEDAGRGASADARHAHRVRSRSFS
jgi:hypothetical protein